MTAPTRTEGPDASRERPKGRKPSLRVPGTTSTGAEEPARRAARLISPWLTMWDFLTRGLTAASRLERHGPYVQFLCDCCAAPTPRTAERHRRMADHPNISDHGLIGDLQTAARLDH